MRAFGCSGGSYRPNLRYLCLSEHLATESKVGPTCMTLLVWGWIPVGFIVWGMMRCSMDCVYAN